MEKGDSHPDCLGMDERMEEVACKAASRLARGESLERLGMLVRCLDAGVVPGHFCRLWEKAGLLQGLLNHHRLPHKQPYALETHSEKTPSSAPGN